MPANIVVPDLGESIVEATVVRWLKREGEPVAAGETVVEIETDKVNLEIAAEKGGVLRRIARQAGEDVKVGEVLGTIDDSASSPAAAPARAASPKQDAPKPRPPAATPAGAPVPSAARAPAAAGKAAASPSGAGAPSPPAQPASAAATAAQVATEPRGAPAIEAASAPFPAAGTDGAREERVRMSSRRRTIARRLVEAQHAAAMLTTFNEVDMSRVQEIRRKRKEAFRERHGVGLGIMSFFVKATVAALKAFPRLNAEIQGDHMVLKRHYDIGIAVGAREGLVVPVLRDAEALSFAEIERRIKAFADKAEKDELAIEDLRGGTFTITNGGVFGSLLSTPILNPPEVGILGLHRIEERPIAIAGQVVIRPMMYVALSYDHRIVDGREAVKFLVRVKELVEEPEGLVLEG